MTESELIVFLLPLANARRHDIVHGFGLQNESCFQTIKNVVSDMVSSHNPHVIMLTEFHRGMTHEKYHEWTNHMHDLGYPRHLEFKRNLTLDHQHEGINVEQPDLFSTVVYTRLDNSAVLKRFLYSEEQTSDGNVFINGGIHMRYRDNDYVFAHLSLSFGTGSSYDTFREEVNRIRSISPRVKLVGDLNITDVLAHRLAQDDPDMLQWLRPCDYNFQPDFISGPCDWVRTEFLLTEEQLDHLKMKRHIVECVSEGIVEKARIVSTLGMFNTGWNKAHYYHPITRTEITGLDHEAVADIDNEARKTFTFGHDGHIFDHVMIILTDRFE